MLSNVYHNHRLRVFSLHFFIWLLIFSFPVVDAATGYGYFKVLRIVPPVCVFYLNYSYLVPQLLLKKKLAAYSIIIVLLIAVTSFVMSVFEPPHMLHRIPKRFLPPHEEGILHIRIFPFTVMIILHLSVSTLLRIYTQLNISLKVQEEIQAQKKIVELNLLKAQLNPHFFFNSLNTIYSLSIKKSAKTPEAVLNLADLMRYMLYETNKDMVRLDQDILYIENYIELQKLRLTPNNHVSVKVQGDAKGIIIPPLLFISFVENAFKYGTSPNRESSISISFIINKDSLTFKVVNDVNPAAGLKLGGTGIGIKNAVERLKLYFPERNIFSTAMEDGKYSVELTLFLK